MKIIIAGSRTLNVTPEELDSLVKQNSLPKAFTVVSGRAGGIDRSGEAYAAARGLELIKFPADWNKFGKAAGPIRNAIMAKEADALILIWDGESKGSANMKQNMLRLNKPVFELIKSK